MTRLEASVASGTPRNTHSQSLRTHTATCKRTATTAVVIFLLAAAFALTGTPAVSAAPGCGNPGACSDFSGMQQLGEQSSAHQLPESSP